MSGEECNNTQRSVTRNHLILLLEPELAENYQVYLCPHFYLLPDVILMQIHFMKGVHFQQENGHCEVTMP
jgi:hypothetical protein